MKTKINFLVVIFLALALISTASAQSQETEQKKDPEKKTDERIIRKEKKEPQKEETVPTDQDKAPQDKSSANTDKAEKNKVDSSSGGAPSGAQPENPDQEESLIPNLNLGDTKALTEEDMVSKEFKYIPGGRRDPFIDLLKGNSISNLKREVKEGIAGLTVAELVLVGIIVSKSNKYVALLKGPDGKPYDVYVGDNVYDGEIIKIDLNTVYFKRSLTLGMGGTKEKIITKSLIPEEEAEKK